MDGQGPGGSKTESSMMILWEGVGKMQLAKARVRTDPNGLGEGGKEGKGEDAECMRHL